MSFTRMMEGNEAAAWGVKLSRVEVIPVYPITPQTELISAIASMIATGEMKAQYIKVEGEHTAMAAAIGASAAGARVFTSSAAQGIVYMEEALWMPPGMRLPIVMCIVNRALAPLGGLRPDHNDSLLQRDTGWIQLYCENSQEVLDTIIQAYRIGEDRRVYLPVAVCYDGYFVSATATPVTVPGQEEVDLFLPPYKHELYSLMPEDYRRPQWGANIARARYEVQRAMERAKRVIEEVDRDYKARFGRGYDGLLEEYSCEDAEAVLITMGSMTGTARDVIDEMREEGKRIGLVKMRGFRPFPSEELREMAKRYHAIGVVDRNTSYGSAGGGIIAVETARALYPLDDRPLLLDFHVGLGGSDVTMRQIRYMADRVLEALDKGRVEEEVEWVELIDLGEVM
ncbi:MAG: transketolase C-terminal domain-containing protein [Candidatus Bathyarchaeia archaeon]|nr:pyruvate ferredoxin oxidoreductase [Candidatus Bathyarchaeota archaeon]